MEIVKIAAFVLVALSIVLIFKDRRQDLAVQISLAAGILIFFFMIDKLKEVLNVIELFASRANIDAVYIKTVFKVLGIAYIATFCSEICKDAGEGSLASKIEFAGKILILILAIPILMAVLNSILKIL